ncbi:DUF362 domain-containing protein [Halomarina pelagica]|uniref:DUF362 domain-containing protein n=1 Tax=Halomarina pelagica TaxID=2961599 RepID=UPI0020C5332C|nr:DUF362 domain-containing protein [Halomarina sp. BND7]
MEFPDADTAEAALPDVAFPSFHEVRYDPPAPTLDDVGAAARRELDALPLEGLDAGATVAVGLGSRGITDVVPVARAVVAELRARALEPIVVPAMGSHGGATAEGQRRTLAGIGLTEESLGCPIDPRMDTEHLGTSAVGGEVHHSTAALDADAVLVINRVKAHTNFDGRFESGLCKMLTVGLGKQVGAKEFHETALVEGYEAAIEAALDVVTEHSPVVGGVAIVENFFDETALVEGVPVSALPDRETGLLERAYEYMPTLPYDELDVLVVDEIGKDVSGAGMDTNVIGRYRVLNADEPESPDVKRIVVRGLTEATHGNGNGIGLADVTTAAAVEELDLHQVYTNALTSGSLSKARLPVVLPNDRLALLAAVSTIGPYDPETVRIAWIRDTSHLSSFRVSAALAAEEPDHVEVVGPAPLSFPGGSAQFD